MLGGGEGKALGEGAATLRFGLGLLVALDVFVLAAVHLATLILAKRTVPVVEIAIVDGALVENVASELGVAFAQRTFAVARLVL